MKCTHFASTIPSFNTLFSYFEMASSHSSDSLSGLASGLGKETNRSHSSIRDVAFAKFTGRRFTLSVSTTSMKASDFLW